MKIIEIKKIENCLEGKNVWDILLNSPLTKSFVSGFSSLGKVVVHDFKPKPFFQLIVRGKFTLKGSIGNMSFRMLMPDEAGTEQIDIVKQHIENSSL